MFVCTGEQRAKTFQEEQQKAVEAEKLRTGTEQVRGIIDEVKRAKPNATREEFYQEAAAKGLPEYVVKEAAKAFKPSISAWQMWQRSKGLEDIYFRDMTKLSSQINSKQARLKAANAELKQLEKN